MATPTLTPQTVNIQYAQHSPRLLNLGIVKDSAGAPLDISSGFTAKTLIALSNAIDYYSNIELAGTYTYGADGSLTLALTQAQANAAPVGSWNMLVAVSNDSFTTGSIHGQGRANVQASSFGF